MFPPEFEPRRGLFVVAVFLSQALIELVGERLALSCGQAGFVCLISPAE